jgi:hypothetical protein
MVKFREILSWCCTFLPLVVHFITEGRKCVCDHMHELKSSTFPIVPTMKLVHETLERTTETLQKHNGMSYLLLLTVS